MNLGKAVVDNTFRIAFIKGRKTQPVESDETVKGRKPQISVRRLRNLADAVLRQTVIRRPGVKAILSEGSQATD